MISGLEVLKRNESILRRHAGSIVDKLDIDLLQKNMNEIVVNGQINMEKLDHLTDIMTSQMEGTDSELDEDTQGILELMNSIGDSSDVEIKEELEKKLVLSEEE